MATAYIGTSGFSYPHWGKGIFYPQDLPQRDWFSYYAKHFDTVELNVSFYRLPKREVFEGWREKAGEKFVFSVKGSRFITHVKRLKDCQEPVERFFEAVQGLKVEDRSSNKEVRTRSKKEAIRDSKFQIRNSVNVILWQLPPKFKANPERLAQFLKILPKGWRPSQAGQPRQTWRYAFEFRNTTWLTVKIYKLLREYDAAIVFQDNPGWPIAKETTADFVYLRFHGKTALYSSCYTEKELEEWAKKIQEWLKRGLDVYAYFNNDALGYAIENAKTLISNVKT